MLKTHFFKIVYWGKIFSGKSRSLELWKRRSEARKGYWDPSWIDLEDHTFFLDFLPLEWTLADGSILVVHLYGAPGASSLYPNHLGIMEFVDGIIFCIDRSKDWEFNLDEQSRWMLNRALRAWGYNRGKFQMALQDVTPAEDPGQLTRAQAEKKLRLKGYPWFGVNLQTGEGLEKPLYWIFSKLIPNWKEQGIEGARLSYPRHLNWRELFNYWINHRTVSAGDLGGFLLIDGKGLYKKMEESGSSVSTKLEELTLGGPEPLFHLGNPSHHLKFFEELSRSGNFSFPGLLRELSFQACAPWVDPIYYLWWLKDYTLVDLLPGQLPKESAEEKLIFPLAKKEDRIMVITPQAFLLGPDSFSEEETETGLFQRLNLKVFRVLAYPWRVQSLISECYEPILQKHKPRLVPKEPPDPYAEITDEDIDNLFSED